MIFGDDFGMDELYFECLEVNFFKANPYCALLQLLRYGCAHRVAELRDGELRDVGWFISFFRGSISETSQTK